MSLSRSFVQRSSRLASNASSSSMLAGSSTSSSRQLVGAARAQYRSYSSSGSSKAGGSSRSKTPVAFGLVGLGGLTSWLGFGDSKDPKTTQEGMLGSRPDVDYGAVYRDVAAILENEDYDDGSYGPTLVRLAWHCSGTYDKHTNTGGSNGATMRFAPEANHGANAGLKVVRDLLEPIKQKYPGLSYSDLWTLAGVVAVQEMGGPQIPWRSGRKDGLEENCTPDGRLPDGDKGADHIRQIFYKMGFNDQEIVALSGAHALGRCHKDRSGFDGPWTFSPITFSNQYYELLLKEKWNMRKWNGPPQFEDSKTKSLMMLLTDMALATDKAFRPYTEKYAKNEEAFFSDFSKAFAKLLELGVPAENFAGKKPMLLPTVSDWEAQQEKK